MEFYPIAAWLPEVDLGLTQAVEPAIQKICTAEIINAFSGSCNRPQLEQYFSLKGGGGI